MADRTHTKTKTIVKFILHSIFRITSKILYFNKLVSGSRTKIP